MATLARALPERPRLRRLERAEPERLLALPVRRVGNRHRRARLYIAPRAHLRRAEGGLAEDPGLRRLAGPARRRQPGGSAAHPVADGVHPQHGTRLPRQRAGEADHGRLRDPPVPRALRRFRRPGSIPGERRSGSPTTTSSSACSERRSTAPRSPGSKLPVAYTEFGVQTKIPESAQAPYTNLESPLGQDAVAEQTQARYYREALELSRLPADRDRALLLPSDRRARSEPLAVRALLRRPEAEVEPAGDQGGRREGSRG